MPARQVALAEAKAGFSAIVRQVNEDGARFTVTKDGKPVARIIPFGAVPPRESAFGALHRFADPALTAQGAGAFARASREKHACPA